MKILIVNGPNLNMLGKRDVQVYGSKTLTEVIQDLAKTAECLGVSYDHFQSNSEGEIIDHLQSVKDLTDGILINAGALTHCGLSLRDALIDSRVPIVEVHISNIHAREEYRRHSVIEDIAVGQIAGIGWRGYSLALIALINFLNR